MAILIIICFIIGYALIAFEHPLGIDKAAPALFTGVICWVILIRATQASLGLLGIILAAAFFGLAI